MSIKIMTGASGHGKTYKLYKEVTKRAAENPQQRFIVVVPEQSSLQAQKDLVEMNPNKGIFNIDVLTFGRMSYTVFDELGFELLENIDDTGKNIIVRHVLQSVGDKLNVIRPSSKPGFISDIKSVISELKQYGVKPDKLDEIALKMQGRLGVKLADIKIIYKAFEEYINGKYSTVEDRPEAMLAIMDESSYFDDAMIVFDGFTGFTPVQYRIISKLAKKAEDIVFTATLRENEPYNVITGEEDLFLMSKEMISRISQIAQETQQSFVVDKVGTDYDNYRFAKSEALDFLERNIFAYRVYDKQADDIVMAKLDSVADEVHYVAAQIKSVIKDKQIRYRDIAVVSGDMELYKAEAARVFAECEVPCFFDVKRSILGNILVEYIRSAIEIFSTNFTYESVFSLLKNGLCEMGADNRDILENYVLAYGIRGYKRWNDKFTREYPRHPEKLEIVQEERQHFLDIIEPLTPIAKGKNTVKEYAMAVYNFMEAEGVYDKLLTLAKEFELTAKGSEYKKTYGAVVGLLDQMCALMGDEEMNVKEFLDILLAGFEEIKVGAIPPTADSIVMGDIERTRLEHVKVLFVLGVNEGIIPKLSGGTGILSEMDRRNLEGTNIELAPSPRQKIFIQNYYLYLNLTEPEQKLYILCHKFNPDGKEVKESRIFGMVHKMYPKNKIITNECVTASDWATNLANTRHAIMEYNASPEIIKYFMAQENYYKWLCEIAENVSELYRKDEISKLAAEELFAEMKRVSISRIEQFAGCAFSHFAKYGLELHEREIYKIDNVDMGVVYHSALQEVFAKLKEEGRRLQELTEDERHEITVSAVDKAIAVNKVAAFYDNATNQFLKHRIINTVDRTLWALGTQLGLGKFVPQEFEHSFEMQFDDVKVFGTIDRVDTAENGDNLYVKVIDYKSSDKDLSLDDVYAGTSLQLMVYLKNALVDMEKSNPLKKVIAAGALYNHICNPFATIEKTSDDPDKKLLDAMRPKGAISTESVSLYDENLSSGASMAARIKYGKMGVDGSNLYSDEQLRILADYSIKKLSELKNEIVAGEVEALPIESKCEYCPYMSVCKINKDDHIAHKQIKRITEAPDMWRYFKGEEVEE